MIHSHHAFKPLQDVETILGYELSCKDLSNYIIQSDDSFSKGLLPFCFSCSRKEDSVHSLYSYRIKRMYQCTLCHSWSCRGCYIHPHWRHVTDKLLCFCQRCYSYSDIFHEKAEKMQSTIPMLVRLQNVEFHFEVVDNDYKDAMVSRKRRRQDEKITEVD